MIIAGNWKMNLSEDEAVALASVLDGKINALPGREIILFPPAILIPAVFAALSPDTAIAIGGQDCHADGAGAHTGDIAAAMLADAGCRHVLVGHSERRQNHGEDDCSIAAKAATAHSNGLSPMICVGETLEAREAGSAFDVVSRQICDAVPASLPAGGFAIAYEPVWAIGTGRVASEDDIAAMHAHIRAELSSHHKQTPILYGGSVKPDNAAGILSLDGVDGALVGGASLAAGDFMAIVEAA